MQFKALFRRFELVRGPLTAHSRHCKALYHIRNYAARAYVHRVGQEALIDRNLGEQILITAEEHGERLALIACQENVKLTYKQAKAEAANLAVKLADMGLRRGEHLGIWAPNTRQWYITLLAANLGGYPLVCLNPAFQAPELEYALKKAKVKALITMDVCGKLQFSKILDKLLKDHKNDMLRELRFVLVKGDIADNNYDEILSREVNSQSIADLYNTVSAIPTESACSLLFTSGTTGQSKAAVLTHFNFINETYYFGNSMKMHESPKKVCLTVPMFHVFGKCAVLSALRYGSTVVLPSPTFNAAAALAAIEQEQCNVILGTPTMYIDMLQQHSKQPRSIESLELGFVGGAACSPELYSQTKQIFALKKMLIGYGATECTGATFSQDGSETVEQASQTVGQPYDHGEAKVVNDKGETVAFGEPGELCLRGYFVMKGYFEDEARTREVLSADGWLKMGDEFILEPSGVAHVIGRKKDMIIRGGENIYPKEIEDFLDTHEDILESQIIGVPDQRLGEEVCVFLRLKPGVEPLTELDIKKYCEGNIAYFKIPRYVQVVNDFPKTNSGKIQKFKLREMFKNINNNEKL